MDSHQRNRPVFKNVLPIFTGQRLATGDLAITQKIHGQASCVMLNNQIALTAAHNAMYFKKDRPAAFVMHLNSDGSPSHSIIDVLHFYPHPKYNYLNDAENDIAVLSLQSPVPGIIPIDIDAKPSETDRGTVAVGCPGNIPFLAKIPGLIAEDNSRKYLITTSLLPEQHINNSPTSLDQKLLVRHGMSGGGLFRGEHLIGILVQVIGEMKSPRCWSAPPTLHNANGVSYSSNIAQHRDWIGMTIERAKKDIDAARLSSLKTLPTAAEPPITKDLKSTPDTKSADAPHSEHDTTPLLLEAKAEANAANDTKVVVKTVAIQNLIQLINKILMNNSWLYWISKYNQEESYTVGLPVAISEMQDILTLYDGAYLLSQLAQIAKRESERRHRFFSCCTKPLSIETLAFYHCFAKLDPAKPETITETQQKLFAWIRQYGNEDMKNLIPMASADAIPILLDAPDQLAMTRK